MTGGTSNIVRIFGSTYSDYGIQPDGPDRDAFSEAGCVDRWDLFDSDASIGPMVDRMRTICDNCPALDLCAKGENVTSPCDIHGFRAGKTRDERRSEKRGTTPRTEPAPTPEISDGQWRELLDSSATVNEVAEQLGTSYWVVRKARVRLGYHSGQELKARDRALRALYESGYTVQQAADRMGISRQAADHVRRRLVTEGVEFPETRGGARGRSQIERQR